MTDHIPDTGKMVSARDVIAEAIWLYEREIAGAPLPYPAWATFRANDPETAAIYETHAGCILSALAAAGFAVVPVSLVAELADDVEARVMREYSDDVMTRVNALRRARDLEIVNTARAMIAAAKEPQG